MKRRSELLHEGDPLAFPNLHFLVRNDPGENGGVTVTCQENGVSAWGPDLRSAVEAERTALAQQLGLTV